MVTIDIMVRGYRVAIGYSVNSSVMEAVGGPAGRARQNRPVKS